MPNETLYLPPFAKTDAIMTVLCEGAEDYAPRCSLVENARRKPPREDQPVSPGSKLEFGIMRRYDRMDMAPTNARYDRVDVTPAIVKILELAHVSYAVTRVTDRSTGSGYTKDMRLTFFDLRIGRAAFDNVAARDLGGELLRFVGRNLWTVEVYRNPRADMPGKTGYQLRLKGRVPFRDAVGEKLMVWPKDAAGRSLRTLEKVPMQPSFSLHLPPKLSAGEAAA